MEELKEIFRAIDTMMIGCDIDYKELKTKLLDEKLLRNIEKQGLVIGEW